MRSERCHLVISNAERPALEGIRLLVEARQMAPWVPVMILVDPGDVPTAVRAMKAGAADCLERPPKVKQLLIAIEHASEISRRPRLAPDAVLSAAEHRVLDLILEGLKNWEVARELNRSTRTVEVHRRHIMRKLGAQSAYDLVKMSLQTGLLATEQAKRLPNRESMQVVTHALGGPWVTSSAGRQNQCPLRSEPDA
jgi:FixJ family two-component response regulator